ncbi:TonB-dependent receptor [Fluviicola sp.]|uniref:TonB-dependent receptor domain-containing protein n=1 Tax=Fluviicola sp. TaxID=1917219 RepID=UPI0031D4D6BB
MYRIITLIGIFFCFSQAFAQSQQIRFSFAEKEIPCGEIPKQVVLSVPLDGKDSVLLKETFSDCTKLIEVPKIPGVYSFTIRTQLYQPILLSFEVGPNTPDTIDLGELVFKDDVAQLEEVTVTGIQRRFIKVDADKTTITVQDNPVLTVSSIYDAILKIPGIVPYPGGGFAVNGQMASVYFENIPSSLSTDDLMNLLKSLPATSVENIEIISNPGASYDANVSGAVININSISKATKWMSGTLTLNYGLNQNNKTSPSLVLSGRRSKWSWQFQTGISYNERSLRTTSERSYTSFNPVAKMSSERKEQITSDYFYWKPSLTFRLNKHASLILNYNGSVSNWLTKGEGLTYSQEITPVVSFQNTYSQKGSNLNNEFIVKYRNNFDTLNRVLSFTAYYSDNVGNNLRKNMQRVSETDDYSLLKYQSGLSRFYARADAEIPFPKIKFNVNAGLKYSYLFNKNLGSYNLQNPSAAIFDNPFYIYSIDYRYNEDNLAAYVELKKGFGKKVSVGAGLRAENFTLNGRANGSTSLTRNYFNLFPSFNAIYRITPDINLIGTYSRKIGIPSYSQFDPNNNGYYDSYSTSVGNSQLKPNFYDNAELKFSVFDYMQLSAHYTHSQTLNLTEVIVEPNSLQTVQTFKTYQNVNSMSYFMSIPVPFGIFKQGMDFFNHPVDIDKISFLYLYGEHTKTYIDGYNYLGKNKGIWTFGVYSQFILPWKIRMNVDYYIANRGNYQIYTYLKNRTALEVVFSREFYDKKLKTSLSFQDIFNTERDVTRVAYPNLNLDGYTKWDTRIIWFKVSYSFGRYEKPESDGPAIPQRGDSGTP